jgi:hypothetical protein
MKKIFFSASIVLLTLSSSAFAQFEMVRCQSILGAERDLSLVIVNSALKEIRPISNNTERARALIPRKIMNQCMPGKTLYTIVGSDILVEIENKILNGEAGILKVDAEDFNCSL